MSMQMAIGKERFMYYSFFVGTAMLFLPIAAFKTHNPGLVGPLFPMTVAWSFQYDMYYGNLMIRAQKEAARLIRDEPERFFLPEGSRIIDQADYNEKILGKSADYKPKII